MVFNLFPVFRKCSARPSQFPEKGQTAYQSVIYVCRWLKYTSSILDQWAINYTLRLPLPEMKSPLMWTKLSPKANVTTVVSKVGLQPTTLSQFLLRFSQWFITDSLLQLPYLSSSCSSYFCHWPEFRYWLPWQVSRDLRQFIGIS